MNILLPSSSCSVKTKEDCELYVVLASLPIAGVASLLHLALVSDSAEEWYSMGGLGFQYVR